MTNKSNENTKKNLRDSQGRFTSEGASYFGQKGGERTQINRKDSQREGKSGGSRNRSNARSIKRTTNS